MIPLSAFGITFPFVILILVVLLGMCAASAYERKERLGFYSCLSMGVGAFSNMVVIYVNNNRMPACTEFYSLSPVETETYVAISPETQLVLLGDIIHVPNGIVSVGDIYIILGVILLVLHICGLVFRLLRQ